MTNNQVQPIETTFDFFLDTAYEFFGAQCIAGPRYYVSLPDIHSRYQEWCRGRRVTPAHRKWLTRYARKWVDRTAKAEGWEFRTSQRRVGHPQGGKAYFVTYYLGLRLL